MIDTDPAAALEAVREEARAEERGAGRRKPDPKRCTPDRFYRAQGEQE